MKPVTQSMRGYLSSLNRTWTIRKPTHIIVDSNGEIVAMIQRRGDYYSAVQVIQFGDDKPTTLFGMLEGDLMRLEPSAFHYMRGLDDTEHPTGGYTGAAKRGELQLIEI